MATHSGLVSSSGISLVEVVQSTRLVSALAQLFATLENKPSEAQMQQAITVFVMVGIFSPPPPCSIEEGFESRGYTLSSHACPDV